MEKDLSYRRLKPILTSNEDVVRLGEILTRAGESIYVSGLRGEGINLGLLGEWNAAVYTTSWCLAYNGDISLDEFEKRINPILSLKKEEVRVRLHNDKDLKRLRQILQDAKEPIYRSSKILKGEDLDKSTHAILYHDNEWLTCDGKEYSNRSDITLDELEQLLGTNKQQPTTKPMEKKTVTRKALSEIYQIVCYSWQEKIINIVETQMGLFKDEVTLTQEEIDNAWDAADTSTRAETIKAWLTKNGLTKLEPQYKVGDWVFDKEYGVGKIESIAIYGDSPMTISSGNWSFKYSTIDKGSVIGRRLRLATPEEIKKATVYPDGTPCLVRDNESSVWYLFYANGKGAFHCGGSKDSYPCNFKYHQKLDINNLPVNRPYQ